MKIVVAITEKNIKIIKEYFTKNENKSIHKGSYALDLNYSTIWTILRKSLKWKAYKPLKVNRLMESNMSNRVTVACWLFSQPDGFEQKVC